MTWREWKAAWRWWDVVGIALLTAAPLVTLLMLFGVILPLASLAAAKPNDHSFDLMTNLFRFMLWASGGSAGFGFFWVFVVAPWLGSGSARFTESRTPLLQSQLHRLMAWGPCALAAGGSLVVLIEAIVNWVLTDVWEPSGLLSIWMLPVVGILALHGWCFNHLLQRRNRTSTQRAQVCFNCAYSLAEIPNCQLCPECGMEVSADSRHYGSDR